MKYVLWIIGILILLYAGNWLRVWYAGKTAPSQADTTELTGNEKVAYVAGGCFWCTESDYEKIDGVIEAISGYMGGDEENPSYNEVAGGNTQHRESVKVVYDPDKLTFQRIVLELLRETDPTDDGGSFYDRGRQYTSAIYYQNDEEKRIAEEAIADVEERGVFDKPIVTSVEPAKTFWVAEDYHQDFYKKSSVRYNYYRQASGRDAFIAEHWGSGEYDDLFAQ